MPKLGKNYPFILLLLVIFTYIFSAINPYDSFAWLGQSTPAVLYVGLLMVLYPRVRFTNFAYTLVFIHVLLLLYGAHYTYSNNPLFNSFGELFGWERNYFDRVGHFAQGFIPAFLFKEFYLLGGFVKRGKVLLLIVILSCLGLSASYELGEFALIKLLDVPVDAVMGTQGDMFDSYWDMLWALMGSIFAVTAFGKFHNYQMRLENFDEYTS